MLRLASRLAGCSQVINMVVSPKRGGDYLRRRLSSGSGMFGFNRERRRSHGELCEQLGVNRCEVMCFGGNLLF